ncbi:hypothetical protein NMY22_g18842 [Coprinellus aureogranulatus]|nr:hypothetical protein NMY22_g18842 [Coprinellus aureogranulatus]
MSVGDALAYWNYIKGNALSVLGWSHLEQGMFARYRDGEHEKGLKLIQMASEYYLSAAECYPEDEPHHASFLRKHLECLCYSDRPLRETLPVCERIRAVVPKAIEVYGAPPFDTELRNNLSEVEQFEAQAKSDIMRGRLNLDSAKLIVIPRVGTQKTEKDDLPFTVVLPGDAGYDESVKL